MIKLIIKLAIAALIANAAWRLGTSYMSFYKFQDAVKENILFGNDKSVEQLRARTLELAAQYDLPLPEDGFTIKRSNEHTVADGSFNQPVQLLPGYTRPWPFSFHIDVLSIDMRKPVPQ
jgi:hypothetical protein